MIPQIPYINTLDSLKALKLVELNLEENPLKQRYEDQTIYVRYLASYGYGWIRCLVFYIWQNLTSGILHNHTWSLHLVIGSSPLASGTWVVGRAHDGTLRYYSTTNSTPKGVHYGARWTLLRFGGIVTSETHIYEWQSLRKCLVVPRNHLLHTSAIIDHNYWFRNSIGSRLSHKLIWILPIIASKRGNFVEWFRSKILLQ